MYQSIFTDELRLPFSEALDMIAAWNLRKVDLRGNINGREIEYLSDRELTVVKAQLDERGLSVGALESSLAKVHLPDRKRHRQEMEKLEGIVRAAHALETDLVRAFFYWQPKNKLEAGQLGQSPEYLERVLDLFAPMADRAKTAGLTLAFENCGVTTDEVATLLEALAEPGWGLAWDISNQWFSDLQRRESQVETFMSLAGLTRIVHVKARGSVPELGEMIPYQDILAILKTQNFNGPVSIETHSSRDPVRSSKSALETIRRAWPA